LTQRLHIFLILQLTNSPADDPVQLQQLVNAQVVNAH
jgi:hypothetical protein